MRHCIDVKIKEKATFVNWAGKSKVVRCNDDDSFNANIGIIIGILRIMGFGDAKIDKVVEILET